MLKCRDYNLHIKITINTRRVTIKIVRSLGLNVIDVNGQTLLDLFMQDILQHNRDVFAPITIIVPNMSLANWLHDELAFRLGVIANVKFRLLNQFIDEVYIDISSKEQQSQHSCHSREGGNPAITAHESSVTADNPLIQNAADCHSREGGNPASTVHEYSVTAGTLHNNVSTSQLLPLSELKYHIYNYIVNHHNPDFLKQLWLVNADNSYNLHKIYQLAFALERIFVDYLRYRTKEMIYQDFTHKLPTWQAEILQHILQLSKHQQGKKTFLDVYKFLLQADSQLKHHLPANLYLFNVTDISCANLELVHKFAEYSNIFYYQVVPSLEYYYDLLDSKTVTRLSRKVLKEPEISVNELYLTDGNPLVANLGVKSRELNELLIAHDVEFIDLEPEPSTPQTLLAVLQSDIHNLRHRLSIEQQLSATPDYYATPITDTKLIADKTLAIHVCHSRLREVQVLFDLIGELLIANPHISLADIVVYAPQIELYQDYIQAVFANQYVIAPQTKIPYHICGGQSNRFRALFSLLEHIFNLDYTLKVSDIFALLNQSLIMANLALTSSDIALIYTWLKDNHTHFGFDAQDYEEFNYTALDLFSWQTLLKNLLLSATVLAPQDNLAAYSYDNVEFMHIHLLNCLIALLDFLLEFRSVFYCEAHNFRHVTLVEAVAVLELLHDNLLRCDDDKIVLRELINYLRQLPLGAVITLPVLVDVITNYVERVNGLYLPTGRLTFMSLGVVTHVPFKVVYILGLNDGEYPRLEQKNRLNFLTSSAAFADINATLTDKQVLLDTILSAKEQLHFSFIGRRDTDNKELAPSVSLALIMSVLKNMLANEADFYSYIYQEHALHPFSSPNQNTDLGFWQNIATTGQYRNLHWQYANTDIALLPDNLSTIQFKQLVDFYSYSNQGLYAQLGIISYKNDNLLKDYEEPNLFAQQASATIFKHLQQLFTQLQQSSGEAHSLSTLLDEFTKQREQIYKHLYQRGLLLAGDISVAQFNFVFERYVSYKRLSGNYMVKVTYIDDSTQLKLEDYLYLTADYQVILLADFRYFFTTSEPRLNYWLKIKGLIYLLVLQHGQLELLSSNNNIQRDKIILRYALDDKHTSYLSLKDGVDSAALLSAIFKFYVDGGKLATFIDEKLIAALAKEPDLNKVKLSDYLTDEVISKLNQDRIFNANFSDFFAQTDIHKNSLLFTASLMQRIELS